MSGCSHEWLIPSKYKTTCRNCGREAWLYYDQDPEPIIRDLENKNANLRFVIENQPKKPKELVSEFDDYASEHLESIFGSEPLFNISHVKKRNEDFYEVECEVVVRRKPTQPKEPKT